MNAVNKKSTWLWVYYGVSFVLFTLGLIIVLTDKTGFGVLSAGPFMLAGVLLAIISYIVYLSKKNNKKIIANSILWLLFLVSISTLIWEIIQIATWFKTVGFQGWPMIIGNLILSILLLILITVLNRKDS